ncbi:hypothetical protein ACFLRW_04110 [Acidobacteriota bacterium]
MSVSRRLVNLIENDAEHMTLKWLEDVKMRIKTPTYHTFNEKDLFNTAYKVYKNLGKWISWETTKDHIAAEYMAHGARRRDQEFELSEVVQALILMRRHLWQKVLDDGLLDTALDMYQAMDLNRQVVRYFDRAIYFTIVGYMKNR